MKGKRLTKRLLSLSMAVLFMAMAFTPITQVPVMAARNAQELGRQMPGFWPIFDRYVAAVNSGDPNRIIQEGEAYVAFLMNGMSIEAGIAQLEARGPGNAVEIDLIYNALLSIVTAYEEIGDIPNIVNALQRFIPFVEAYGKYMEGEVDLQWLAINQNKLAAFNAQVSLFLETQGTGGSTVYHGAKYEPSHGVFFGETWKFPTYEHEYTLARPNSSGLMFYVQYETEFIRDFEWALRTLSQQYQVIQIAWNLADEGSTIPAITNDRQKIEREADFLNSLGTPILLRFAAEMDIWCNPPDPAQFIEAYRFVADIMRARAPNVAMVWSVNSVSGEGLNWEMFYPGDAYVDWVGMSLYVSKYFLGNRYAVEADQALFGAGRFANPINKLAPLVEQFGNRKPIMISEGGASNFSNTNQSDQQDWAETQMRLFYSSLPMVFPEVKAMFYFNVCRAVQGESCNYALHNAPRMNRLYADLTTQGHFIRGQSGSAAATYTRLGTATAPANSVRLHVYAPFHHIEGTLTVDFLLNGRAYGTSNIIPYTQTIDFSGYTDGDYALRVNVFVDGRLINAADYNVRKAGNSVTISADAVGGSSGPLPQVPQNQQNPPTPQTPQPSPAGQIGSIQGDVLYSDVTATINGRAIPSFNIDGNTMVIAEDLANYGFNVTWDGETSTLRVVSFDASNPVNPLTAGPPTQPGGTFRMNYFSTAVKTFVNNIEVTGYNIGGQTIIQFDHLEAYGNVAWDGTTRTISIVTR